MLAHLDFQLLLICVSLPYMLSQCSAEVNKCLLTFSSNLDNHKQQQFNSVDQELHNICDRENGIYFKFVDCITQTEHQCLSDPKFDQYICETRKLKMRITRYTWKLSLFQNMCQNTSSQESQAFIKHEPCISTVMNFAKWKCDFNYYSPIKALKDWKTNLNTTCSLWRKFRDCIKQDIKQNCGIEASNTSDYLFHSHQSYFDKYNFCHMEGISSSATQCSYNSIKRKTTTPLLIMSTPTSLSTKSNTHLITEQTQQSLSTNTSIDMISSTETSMPTTYDSLNSNPFANLIEPNATSDELIDNSMNSSLNESSNIVLNEIPNNESLTHFNDSVEKESESNETHDIILADNSIETTDSKLSYNRNTGKLTFSPDSDKKPDSEESISLNSAQSFITQISYLLIISLSYNLLFLI